MKADDDQKRFDGTMAAVDEASWLPRAPKLPKGCARSALTRPARHPAYAPVLKLRCGTGAKG